jgi:hypothetical protein
MVDKPASPWYFPSTAGGFTDAAVHDISGGPISGQKYWLTALQYFNTSAVGSELAIIDSATANVLWRGYAPPSMAVPTALPFDPPLQSTANSKIQMQLVTTGTATRVNAQGFIDP